MEPGVHPGGAVQWIRALPGVNGCGGTAWVRPHRVLFQACVCGGGEVKRLPREGGGPALAAGHGGALCTW